MMRKPIRLQGVDFIKMKGELRPISWSGNIDESHIRVDYKNKFGIRFFHWLNPEEIASFDKTSLPKTKFKERINKV